MLTLDEIRQILSNHPNLSMVSRDVGISRVSLYKIINGGGALYATVERLSEYLMKKDPPYNDGP